MGGRMVGANALGVTEVAAGSAMSVSGGTGPTATVEVSPGAGVGPNVRSGALDCYLLVCKFTAGNSIGTAVGGWWIVPFPCEIVNVRLTRLTAGTSGTLIVDLNRGSNSVAETTLYTTQGNRPSVTAASGDNRSVNATLPDIVNLNQGDFLSTDVDSAEVAGADWVLVVTLQPRS